MLVIDGIYVRYEGTGDILRGVSLNVEEGEIVSVIGSNGAGKTTLLRTISGLVHPHRGTIRFRNEPIHSLAPHKTVNLGISQVPEMRGLFTDQKVTDNLLLGAYSSRFKKRTGKDVKQDLAVIFQQFPLLLDRRHHLAGAISGGEQQILAIARGLMAKPSLLLLDEPSLGLAPVLTKEIFEIILRIRKQGTSILLVEQLASKALEVSDRTYVLETGEIILEGPSTIVARDPLVKKAYLGEELKESNAK